MIRSDLTRLAYLAAMKRDVDLQQISVIATQMRNLQCDIDILRSKLQMRDGDFIFDPARMSGVDMIWRQWVDSKITLHQSGMAELALARELLLDRARLSFARAVALKKLNNKCPKSNDP